MMRFRAGFCGMCCAVVGTWQRNSRRANRSSWWRTVATGPGPGSAVLSATHPLAESASTARGIAPAAAISRGRRSKPDIAKSKTEALIHGEKVVALLAFAYRENRPVATVTTHADPHWQNGWTGDRVEYKSLFHMLPPQASRARQVVHRGSEGEDLACLTPAMVKLCDHIQKLHKDYGIEIVARKIRGRRDRREPQAAQVRAGAGWVGVTPPAVRSQARQMASPSDRFPVGFLLKTERRANRG